jgi:hypothetical protein
MCVMLVLHPYVAWIGLAPASVLDISWMNQMRGVRNEYQYDSLCRVLQVLWTSILIFVLLAEVPASSL